MNEKIKQWLELSVELGVHIECNWRGELDFHEVGILFEECQEYELEVDGGIVTTELFKKWLNQKA